MRSVGWSNRPPDPGAPDSGQERITRLVRTHGEFIWRVLRRFGLSPEGAEDASQNVFMILARKLDQLPHDTERVFLYGTALRVASNARRGVRRRRESGDAELEALPSGARDPERVTGEREEVAELDALLAELPSELCRVLVLSEIEGLTGAQIAELESIPTGTVASRLRRARELMFALAEQSAVLEDRLAVRAFRGTGVT